ncbi:MAG: hypothetical protein V2A71_09495 [Candidatus Eisenbacteria bacterium]
MMQEDGDGFGRMKPIDVALAVVVIGSVWGLSEVVLSSAIKAGGLPYRTGILLGVGMLLMGFAIAAFRKPAMLVAAAVVAILCKQLVVPILHVSVLCKANSCLGVLLQGGGMAGLAYVAGRRLHRSYAVRIFAAAAAALLARGTFYLIGMRLAPCNHLLSFNREGGFVTYTLLNSVPWLVLSAAAFPLGYWIGERAREPLFSWRAVRAPAFYAASLTAICACWVACALVISAGP